MTERTLARRGAGLVIALLLPLACGGEPAADTPADDPAHAETRIAVEPTAENAMPAAILGNATALRGTDVHYVPGDQTTTGYLALPEGEGPFPGLLLIHEWNGLQPRVREVADAMAQEGYVALAVDLFTGRTGSSPEENMALVRETQANMDAVIANLNEAASFLRARDDVSGAIGTMGWCYGGGIALSYAIGGEHHDATAIFYGSLVTDPAELAAIDHEVYGTFAEIDNGIPTDQVNEFVSALRTQGIENDVHIYDAVSHGFWLRVDGDPDLRAGPGLDAWQRLKAYLGRTLAG